MIDYKHFIILPLSPSFQFETFVIPYSGSAEIIAMESKMIPAASTPSEATWFGHPRGIATLFFTEMWERFSYYGMRAFLILYMTAPASQGGLGLGVERAGGIYGLYTGSVWLATIGGGLVADWLLGQYRSALLGAVLIAAGHFTLAFPPMPFFLAGLFLIVLGTGLLKPNVSTMVGSLYEANDPRRDAGYSIFYMGINLGAAIGPFIAGYLGEKVNWHLGFACAGVGMTFGLIQYILGRKYLTPAIDRLAKVSQPGTEKVAKKQHAPFTSTEWKRILAVVVFFLFACIFWSAYEQAGSTLNLFARDYTRLSVLGFSFPASWFQSVPAIFVIILAPLFAWIWVRLGPKEPSSPVKFMLALLFVGIAFLIMVPAATFGQNQGIKISPLWLVAVYFFSVVGELCLSPVGMSLVTKLAPFRIVGMMMGVWFLSISFGNIIAGRLAGLFQTVPLVKLFGSMGIVAIAAAFVLFLLLRPVKKLMGGVH
jgi:proton-dependent oligopeptide transporter, POT family